MSVMIVLHNRDISSSICTAFRHHLSRRRLDLSRYFNKLIYGLKPHFTMRRRRAALFRIILRDFFLPTTYLL